MLTSYDKVTTTISGVMTHNDTWGSRWKLGSLVEGLRHLCWQHHVTAWGPTVLN